MSEKPSWRTSSYTKSENCVEVAYNDSTEVKVRDSKNRDEGMLAFPLARWREFVEFAKRV
ncbi:DUF397 domain-containing protein [Streptomyces chattanoogensis]|uniref:DUF397 domain-containing protein n=1 Tax=Streptomyces chattanoogensis TaxID=66876 RepID=UPI0036A9D651